MVSGVSGGEWSQEREGSWGGGGGSRGGRGLGWGMVVAWGEGRGRACHKTEKRRRHDKTTYCKYII